MLMIELEARLIEISKRYAAVAIQLANAYAVEQAGLHLELVLSGERLSSEAGTIESLAALGRIAELTKAHKEAFQKIMVALSAENAAVFAELPEAEKNERLSGLAEMLNWHLGSQGAFYAAREQWIDAATGICKLIQSCRDTAVFGEAVQFAKDEECDEFERQLARIEDAHQREVSLMNEKAERLSKSLAVLGIQAAP